MVWGATSEKTAAQKIRGKEFFSTILNSFIDVEAIFLVFSIEFFIPKNYVHFSFPFFWKIKEKLENLSVG